MEKPSLPGRRCTISEVAQLWRVNRTTVRSLVLSGKLPAFQLAREGAKKPRWLIRWEDVLAYEQAQPSNQKPSRSRRKADSANVEEFIR